MQNFLKIRGFGDNMKPLGEISDKYTFATGYNGTPM